MHSQSLDHLTHSQAFLGARHEEHERRSWVVVGLTLAMMMAEVGGGAIHPAAVKVLRSSRCPWAAAVG